MAPGAYTARLTVGATVVTTQREIAADDFFLGMFTTALAPGEVIWGVRFPRVRQSAYAKFRHPASGYAMSGVFLAEYIARLWTAPEDGRFANLSPSAARLRWALTGTGLIGLLAVVPAFTVTTGTIQADSDAAAVFCILWVLKLGLYAPAMGTLARVISNERATLASVLIIFVIVLIAAGTATHILERNVQKQLFGSIPAALWWAVVTPVLRPLWLRRARGPARFC